MGYVGAQLYLHPLAAGALLHRLVEALLDVIQVVGGLTEISAWGNGLGALHLPGSKQGKAVCQSTQIDGHLLCPPGKYS